MKLSSLNGILRAVLGSGSDVELSPLLVAKIAADEAVCALRRVRTRPLLDTEWRRIQNEVARAAAQFVAAGWRDDPAAYHEMPPPLSRPRVQRAQSLGIAFEHLRFASEYAPRQGEPGRQRWQRYQANRTAHAWVLRHRGRPRSWIVCIPGYGMGSPFMDLGAFQVPTLFRDLGLNVIIPVLPLHGPRKLGWTSGDGFFSGDCLDTVHAEAQAIWDLRRLLGWVRAQNAPAVGVYGLSLGGYTAALLAAVDAELACVIAGIPPSDFVSLARYHMPAEIVCRAEELGVDWQQVNDIFRVISPLAMEPRVAWERRVLFAGLADRIVLPAQARALYEHWGQPRTVWYAGSHLSFHWEPEVQALVRETLATTLCATAAPRRARALTRDAA